MILTTGPPRGAQHRRGADPKRWVLPRTAFPHVPVAPGELRRDNFWDSSRNFASWTPDSWLYPV